MPVERELEHKSPPGRDLFPNLDDLTEEIEQVGFELVTSPRMIWYAQRQFLRLFHRSSDQTQVAVCLIDQGSIAFYYISLMTTVFRRPGLYDMKLSVRLRAKVLAANPHPTGSADRFIPCDVWCTSYFACKERSHRG